MALKFITAEEAASFVHHDDNVGFSGFTPAGCPKVVPGAIAKKAIAEHEKGNPFQIGMFTGASTGDKLDGELARANAIKFRTPYQSNKDLRALLKTCSNGSSEFMSNVSMSLVSMLYNVQLMKYAGEDGVSAYGVLMYVNMIFQAIYIGYSVGTAPIVSFHYGAGNRGELRGLLRRSGGLLAVCAVCMLAAGQVLAAPLSRLYVGYDPGLFRMTSHAFSIFSFSFLFSGFAIYGSSFFTALNDGLTSAIIAFLRALVFQVGAVLLFPLLWRLDGIWMSIVAAEVMAVVATGIFLLAKRKRYGY